jgi:hypothetical protein
MGVGTNLWRVILLRKSGASRGNYQIKVILGVRPLQDMALDALYVIRHDCSLWDFPPITLSGKRIRKEITGFVCRCISSCRVGDN